MEMMDIDVPFRKPCEESPLLYFSMYQSTMFFQISMINTKITGAEFCRDQTFLPHDNTSRLDYTRLPYCKSSLQYQHCLVT